MVKETRVLITCILMIVSLSMASAVELANFTQVGTLFNIGINTTINVTIGAIGGNNITKVVFTWNGSSGRQGELFVVNTNGTSSNASFANHSVATGSNNHNVTLNFTNASLVLIPNGTTRTFWFDVRARSTETGVQITVNATNESGATNVTILTFYPAFAFTGYIRNETGCATCYQANVNVTIYGVVPNPSGPRSTRALGATISNASGYFKLSNINITAGGFDGYQLKFIYYNNSLPTFSAANDTALKTGAILPDFPRFMYYSAPGGGGFGDSDESEGGFDMTLNGGTFYMQPATTINISANNGSSAVSFGYLLIDQALGFPIESNVFEKTNNVSFVVPASRAYTVSMFRIPGGGSVGYTPHPSYCNLTNDFMNDTTCPSPPKSTSITTAQTLAGAIVNVNQSLAVRKAYVTGCVNLGNSVNNTAINITRVVVRLLPWSSDAGSFIPPADADDNSINLTRDINYTNTGCTYAFYNFSLLNNTGYMIEFYAKNATNESISPGGAWNLAAFLNLTTRDNGQRVNVTAYRLAGVYQWDNVTLGAANTSMIKINAVNSSGSAITTQINANIKIRNTVAGIGTVYYIIDGRKIVNGTFYMPVLNNSNFAKAMIFSQNGPPRETSINLSAGEINITVTSMNAEKGFKKFKSNGTLESVNTSSIPIQMRFLRADSECDVPNAPSNCIITEMNASSFNPLKALLAGNVNMEIKITSTNVSLIFHDYDMMSAKQPPMDSVLNENATDRSTTSGSTAMQETWNFGSFAPVDSYSNVTIVLPYSDTTSALNYINDSASVNISIPLLYDENSRVTYNVSRGDTPVNLSDDFVKYNNSEFRQFVNSSAGVVCNITNASASAYINTSGNYIAFKIPHFSTIGASVAGTAKLVAAESSGGGSSGGGGGGGGGGAATTAAKSHTVTTTQLSEGYTQVLAKNDVVKFTTADNATHNVTVGAVSATSVTITVASTPQTVTLAIGESKKFELTGDTFYDLGVTLTSIANASSATLKFQSIHEAVGASGGDGGASGGTGTPGVDSSNKQEKTGVKTTSEKSVWSFILGAALVAVIAIVILYVLWHIKRNDLPRRVHIRQGNKSIKVH